MMQRCGFGNFVQTTVSAFTTFRKNLIMVRAEQRERERERERSNAGR